MNELKDLLDNPDRRIELVGILLSSENCVTAYAAYCEENPPMYKGGSRAESIGRFIRDRKEEIIKILNNDATKYSEANKTL